jgi:hypothetical protein
MKLKCWLTSQKVKKSKLIGCGPLILFLEKMLWHKGDNDFLRIHEDIIAGSVLACCFL